MRCLVFLVVYIISNKSHRSVSSSAMTCMQSPEDILPLLGNRPTRTASSC